MSRLPDPGPTLASGGRVSMASSPGASGHAPTQLGASGSAPGGVEKACPECGARYPASWRACPRDRAVLVDADELVGVLLSQTYRVSRILGEGAMGRVYEARHARIAGKRYALKTLHPEFAGNAELLTRFQREAEAAASIDSPHVAGVFDVDRAPDGRPFLVAEMLDGKELFRHLTDVGRLDVGPAVRIVRQVCAALSAAHARGIVHRDVKPENVFLTGPLADPLVKVIDFGVSRLEDGSGRSLTQTGVVVGTPAFMAPEQARGERVDLRADIYAAGAVLYAALTAVRPFDRSDAAATLLAVLTEEPARPRSLCASIPEALELVIQRAMAKRAADRYQTIEELDQALAPFDPTPAAPALAPPTPAAVATEHARSRRLGSFFGVALAGAAIGVVSLASAIVRVRRAASSVVTSSEATTMCLVAVAVALAMAAGAWAYARHRSPARPLSALEPARLPLLVGLGAYGFASLLVRVMETVLLRSAVGVAWPVWDALLVVIAFVAAGVAALSPTIERKLGQ